MMKFVLIVVVSVACFIYSEPWVKTYPNLTVNALYTSELKGTIFRSDTVMMGLDKSGSVTWKHPLGSYRGITPDSARYLYAHHVERHVAIGQTDTTGKKLWEKYFWGNTMQENYGNTVIRLKNNNLFCTYTYSYTGANSVGLFITDPTGQNMLYDCTNGGINKVSLFDYNDTTCVAGYWNWQLNSLIVHAFNSNGRLLFTRRINHFNFLDEVDPNQWIVSPRGGMIISKDKSVWVWTYFNDFCFIKKANSLFDLDTMNKNPFVLQKAIYTGCQGLLLCALDDSSIIAATNLICNKPERNVCLIYNLNSTGTFNWAKIIFENALKNNNTKLSLTGVVPADSNHFILAGSLDTGTFFLKGSGTGVLSIDSKDWDFNICRKSTIAPYTQLPAVAITASSAMIEQDTIVHYPKLAIDKYAGTWWAPERGHDSAWIQIDMGDMFPVSKVTFGWSGLGGAPLDSACVYISPDTAVWKLAGKISYYVPNLLTMAQPITGRFVRMVWRNLNGEAPAGSDFWIYAKTDNDWTKIVHSSVKFAPKNNLIVHFDKRNIIIKNIQKGPSQVTVFTLKGQVVFRSNLLLKTGNAVIPLNKAISNGCYIVQIKLPDGCRNIPIVCND